MSKRHTIIPKGKTLDKMTCEVCHKPVAMTRDRVTAKRTWRHIKRDKVAKGCCG